MKYYPEKMDSLTFTIQSLLNLIQQGGDPILTQGASKIIEQHQQQEKRLYDHYVDACLEGRGPVQQLKNKLGLQVGPIENYRQTGKEQKHPSLHTINKTFCEFLSPATHSTFYGTWNPLDIPRPLKTLPDNPEDFETRVYETPLPMNRRRLHLIVGLTDKPLKGWCQLTLNDYHPNQIDLTFHTWHPVEKEWLRHQHSEVHTLKQLRRGIKVLMKRYGHQPERHTLPQQALNNALAMIKQPEKITRFSVSDYLIVPSTTEQTIEFFLGDKKIQWSDLPSETQRAILFNLQGF